MTAHVPHPLPRVRGPRSLLTAAMALILAIGGLTVAAPTASAGGQAPALGAAANYAVLAGTAVTCTDGTIAGNVGVFPSTTFTQTNCPITGTIDLGDTVAAPAQNDFLLAYDQFKALPCDVALTTVGTRTLSPGAYCFDAAATLTGTVLTLDGPSDGIWIFNVGIGGTGALTGTNFSMAMAGGGQASNVYWRVAEAATMTDSDFLGTILAGSITLTRGTFHGRALANAEVTITGTAVTGSN